MRANPMRNLCAQIVAAALVATIGTGWAGEAPAPANIPLNDLKIRAEAGD